MRRLLTPSPPLSRRPGWRRLGRPPTPTPIRPAFAAADSATLVEPANRRRYPVHIAVPTISRTFALRARVGAAVSSLMCCVASSIVTCSVAQAPPRSPGGSPRLMRLRPPRPRPRLRPRLPRLCHHRQPPRRRLRRPRRPCHGNSPRLLPTLPLLKPPLPRLMRSPPPTHTPPPFARLATV